MAKGNRGGQRASGRGGNKPLTQNENDAVFDYTTSKYQTINGALRNGKKLSAKDTKITNDLDSAISKSNLKNGTVLYRGVSVSALGLDKDIKKMSAQDVKNLVGKTIQDKAYTSTSTSKDSASNFAGRDANGYKGNVNLIITTKGDKKGLDVGDNSNFGKGENEVILPRNAKMKITGAKRHLNNLTVYVEY